MTTPNTTTRFEEGRAAAQGLPVAASNTGARDAQLKANEEARREEITRRRKYHAGEQYMARNQKTADELAGGSTPGRGDVSCLPEHLKLQAYSTQISESVEFIATQLADSFVVKAKDGAVDEILQGSLARSPLLASGEEDEPITIVNVLRDALIAGDVAVHSRWDPVEGKAWPEMWPSEQVEFRYAETNRERLEEVRVSERVWRMKGSEEVEADKVTTYRMSGLEAVRFVQYDEEDPEPTERLGLPFIPWRLLRANLKGLTATRGQSVISEVALTAADRYDAVEQLSFAIARYNSHGNVAVIGDSATLVARMEEKIHKDVADVMTFPGGTALQVITLPTDPQMIDHQRAVLLDSLYGAFGLNRVDQSTIEGLGGISGYALEILNRKSAGTFAQIGKQFTRDCRALLGQLLDVTAHKLAFVAALAVDVEEDQTVDVVELTDERLDAAMTASLAVDPQTVYPNRALTLVMGTGFIVDDVMVRDDFVAGMISRREALRQRGYSEPEIKAIEREIAKEKEAASAASSTEGGGTGTAFSDAANSAGNRPLDDATSGVRTLSTSDLMRDGATA